jgi:hypothetical protein
MHIFILVWTLHGCLHKCLAARTADDVLEFFMEKTCFAHVTVIRKINHFPVLFASSASDNSVAG